MDQKKDLLKTDFKEIGPLAKLGKNVNAIGRMINNLHFIDGGEVLNTRDFIRLRTNAAESISMSSFQWGSVVGPTTLGVPSVRVYRGWHMLPHGAFTLDTVLSKDVDITGNGWVITRQTKSGPGAFVTLVFQATQANPSSTTHYETDVCSVAYDAGAISIKDLTVGERNFVATI